ncbi:PucR family transcriptional regulator [Arthrobacter sp. MA-N2]|uniref:PucR family transcriptional regulator n=1 Tax=Arthrobacter sp. MA-N2 TaxID=1101188 RepID=UPI0004B1542D|nr:helix-turn-helix domain-containing protein [Arthrobacter sp. MA-N2]
MPHDSPGRHTTTAQTGRTEWITRLQPAPGQPAASILLPASVGRAEALLGPTAGRWAASIAQDNTARIINVLPEFGGGKKPYEVLRLGVESLIVRVLIHLHSPGHEEVMTAEADSSVREMVRRGISYDHILRALHMTQADLTDALYAACRDLIGAERSGEELATASRELFEFFDAFGDELAKSYRLELEHWQRTGEAQRADIARGLLDGTVGVAEAEAAVGYRIRDRHHIAVVVATTESLVHDRIDALSRQARDILESFGCTAQFLAPTGLGRVMAWGSAPDPADLKIIRPPVQADHVVTVGTITSGEDGFRSSHAEAMAVLRLLTHREHVRPDSVVFADVEVAALMSSDLDLLRRFVGRHLDGLSEDSAYMRDIRRSIQEYLNTDRSLARAAERLHVSRNTITYRLKRAEEILGHPIGSDHHALHTALIISGLLGEVVLRRQSGRD